MKIDRRKLVQAAALSPVCVAMPRAFAQQNLLKFCVPFPAGGITDVVTRILADSMSRTLHRSVIVENRPGAAGVIGTRYVRSAPSDGNTIMFTQSGLVATPLLAKVPQYDPIKDFTAIAMVGQVPNFLVVHESVPARTVPELIAYARTLPNGIECGNAGTNTGGHISAVMLEKLGRFKMLHVPFKGGSEVANALVAGEIKMQVTALSDMIISQIKTGKIRMLAVATSKRSALLPDLPTISEFLPGYGLDGWYGVLAPAGTPLAVRQELADAIRVPLEDPAAVQRMNMLYLEPMWRGPQDFTKVIEDSVSYYQRLIAEFNLELQ